MSPWNIYVYFLFESAVSARHAPYSTAFMLILRTKEAIVTQVMPHFAGTKGAAVAVMIKVKT